VLFAVKVHWKGFPFLECSFGFTVSDVDQLHALDVDIWEHLMNQARDPPIFYGETFESLADSFLQHYGVNRSSISVDNIKEIYSHMKSYFST
jgi:hypothetical protein